MHIVSQVSNGCVSKILGRLWNDDIDNFNDNFKTYNYKNSHTILINHTNNVKDKGCNINPKYRYYETGSIRPKV